MVDRLGISKEAPSLKAAQSLAQPTLSTKVFSWGRVIHFGQEDHSAILVEFGFNRNIYAIRWSDDFQRARKLLYSESTWCSPPPCLTYYWAMSVLRSKRAASNCQMK